MSKKSGIFELIYSAQLKRQNTLTAKLQSTIINVTKTLIIILGL